jgi:hypothetical protein
MKKLLLAIISFMLILSSCQNPFWNPPTRQEEGFWATDEHEMYFIVDLSEHMATIGNWKIDNVNIEIKIGFGRYFNVFVYDNNKIIYDDRGADDNNALLFQGDCKARKKSFTITVTSSNIDSIAVDDVITFNRVDNLPDWMIDMLLEMGEEEVEIDE